MEMVLENSFLELSFDELEMVEGGINWDRVFGGATVYLGATMALLMYTNPVTAGIATVYLVTCAASGAYIGYGLAS